VGRLGSTATLAELSDNEPKAVTYTVVIDP
jgi:hypothetical protein